jgi:6-phosphogluconolactonase
MAFHAYDDREKLAEALAAGIAAVLAGGIATRGSALLAVSGGSTPMRFFERLSQVEIDWRHVTVTLVDERFVSPQSPRSNEGLVRGRLLVARAASANFVPLVRDQGNLDANLAAVARAIHLLPALDAVVLGMGTDGHTASFFPGGDNLAGALDPASLADVIAMNAPGAGEPRVTLTLRRILAAHFIALHIEGVDKRAVYANALREGATEEMPVRAVMRHGGAKLQVFWAP